MLILISIFVLTSYYSVKGVGYYHLHTREAYDVIAARIKTKRAQASAEASFGLCLVCTIICLPCGLALRKMRQKEVLYYDDLTKVINLRKFAAGPSNQIDVPEEVLGRVKKYDEKNRSNTNGYGGPADYTSGTYFAYGAGCGYS